MKALHTKAFINIILGTSIHLPRILTIITLFKFTHFDPAVSEIVNYNILAIVSVLEGVSF